MKPWRMVIHWTAGGPVPNKQDLDHYHYIIAADGAVTTGRFRPEDNDQAGSLKPGTYAAHVLGANTRCIGISMCGMAEAVPHFYGKYPLTLQQWLTAVKLAAALAKRYQIPTEVASMAGHCELEKFWGKPQEGKWDPWAPFPSWRPAIGDEQDAHIIGNIFRDAVRREMVANSHLSEVIPTAA